MDLYVLVETQYCIIVSVMAKDILAYNLHMVLFIIKLTTTRHAKKSSVWLNGPNVWRIYQKLVLTFFFKNEPP